MSHAWMSLYIGQYLSETSHLSAAEHGAFMLLIMHFWQHGEVPEDDSEIRLVTGLDQAQWEESRAVLLDVLTTRGRDGWTTLERAIGKGVRKPARPAIPQDVRREVVNRDGWECVYCGDDEGPFHLDHRMPWARGGKHTVENLCVACRSCNFTKGALTSEEFLVVRGGGQWQ